jgi:probable phosphoglycerate mutase
MRVYFVRHGESASNAAGGTDSRDPDKGDRLTDRGWEQGRLLGKRLVNHGITHIVTSPLLRAQETAAAIDETLHRPIEINNNIHEIILPDRYYGAPTAAEKFGIVFDTWNEGAEGAETFADVMNRVTRFMSYLEKHFEKKNLLVVSHGNFLRFFTARSVMGEDLVAEHFPKFLSLKAINTGITVFEFEDRYPALRGWRLLTWMDHAHL